MLRGLPPRERQICQLVASGLSNREIAQRLEIARQTVKNHLHVIYLTLGVRNRTQLAVLVARPAQRRKARKPAGDGP